MPFIATADYAPRLLDPDAAGLREKLLRVPQLDLFAPRSALDGEL